jgi:hypothetical protein
MSRANLDPIIPEAELKARRVTALKAEREDAAAVVARLDAQIAEAEGPAAPVAAPAVTLPAPAKPVAPVKPAPTARKKK